MDKRTDLEATLTTDAAPAEVLSRNKPATPFTPEEIEALTALAYHSAQAQRNTLLAGMAGAADQLVAERAAALARAEAAETRVRELEEAARRLIATYEGPEEFPGYVPMVWACWPALRALEAALAGSPS